LVVLAGTAGIPSAVTSGQALRLMAQDDDSWCRRSRWSVFLRDRLAAYDSVRQILGQNVETQATGWKPVQLGAQGAERDRWLRSELVIFLEIDIRSYYS